VVETTKTVEAYIDQFRERLDASNSSKQLLQTYLGRLLKPGPCDKPLLLTWSEAMVEHKQRRKEDERPR
jgi:hypothetical protein